MQYNPAKEVIPTEQRAEINKKILDLIEGTDYQGITKEDIYNAYTGDGGLHGLDRNCFGSYYEFSEEKKKIENGQFFTPPVVCEIIARVIRPTDHETLCDPTCGKGDFFNYFNPVNCFGSDIDSRAIKVAKFLYPTATVIQGDIRGYELPNKVDYVIGNPPFNLVWYVRGGKVKSQNYFFQKSAELLKLGGIIVCVVPDSFMRDSFTDGSTIKEVNEEFSFIGQYKLPSDVFKDLGVKDYNTKVMFLQRRSDAIVTNLYDHSYNTIEELIDKVNDIQVVRKNLAVKLRSETLERFDSSFIYKVNKYLYEIKTHEKLKDYVVNSLAYTDKFYTQKLPDGMEYEEWVKSHKITEKMVLSYLKKTVKKQQDKNPEDRVAVVKTKYGFKVKAYSPKEGRKLNSPANKEIKTISMVDLVLEFNELHEFKHPVPSGYHKLVIRKRAEYQIQSKLFDEMGRDPEIDKELKRYVFRNGLGKRSKFNEIQIRDLGLALQKNYAILNWQQGSGKTPAGFYWTTCGNTKQRFIVSTALSINATWKKFLDKHEVDYVVIENLRSFKYVKEGTYILLSFHYMKKYQKQIKAIIKKSGGNVSMLFDESDEITNHGSMTTKMVLNLFRRSKRTLLATGTTTRNNIAEIYSQFEVLFNNSHNFVNYCELEYTQVKDKVVPRVNVNHNKPFPARGGNSHFKRCFNPSKTTVFGAQKHNQNLYNEEHLTNLIGSTILTRKFREIAGDKYDVTSYTIKQHSGEREVYRKIIKEFSAVVGLFYNSTGSSRKDSMLQIIRQIQLLIKATSMPQLFQNYSGGESNKTLAILKMCEESPDTKIAIGCTGLEAVSHYVETLKEAFPDRAIFEITGGDAVKKRSGITGTFEDTKDGILVCTQQSLKSSLNIPTCNLVIIESLQWNIPKIEQFYFRFIRYDSLDRTKVVFINYENTIEVNLLALLMAKERLNDFVKTKEYKEESEVFGDFGIDMDILEQLITKEKDEEGRLRITWGE